VGSTEGGAKRIFTRGNEDFGANALLYAYPERDLVIVVLSHGGSNSAGVSLSRAMHERLERALLRD